MNPRDLEEYRALRATIRERGTARHWLFVAGLALWAALMLAVVVLGVAPLLSIVPLVVLAGTFEAVFALHVGVERVGRYLQVFFDDSWERAAMSFGAPRAGTAIEPLFTIYFGLAAVCNFVTVLVAGPIPAEWAVLGGVHVAFLVRLVLARRAAAGQRAADLARFTSLREGEQG